MAMRSTEIARAISSLNSRAKLRTRFKSHHEVTKNTNSSLYEMNFVIFVSS